MYSDSRKNRNAQMLAALRRIRRRRGRLAMVTRNAASAPSTSNTNTNSATANTTSDTTASDAAANVSYKDGNYTATGNFDTAGGSDTITVSLTLKGEVITDVSTKTSATDADSLEYDGQFNNNIKSAVVGKKINELTLSRVAGSSLTTEGFNGAIAQIERQSQNS